MHTELNQLVKNFQGALSSMYLAGYRIAMIVSGAGSLWFVSIQSGETYLLDSWQFVYRIMALFMIIGIVTTILSKEPNIKEK